MPLDPSLAEDKVNHPYIVAHHQSARERHAQLSRYLFSLLPPKSVRSLLAHESPGAPWILSFAHTREDQIAGRVEPNWSLASASWPTADAHPVIIARRLMQYCICMQTLPPSFDASRFRLPPEPQPCEIVGRWVGAVSSFVANDDDLVSCAEGIELLTLLGMFQEEAGHLRRAWVTHRRALSFCHLMGADRSSMRRPVQSRAAPGDPGGAPCMAVLWRRLNCADRYNSLILGLPLSCPRDAFSRAEFLPWASPLDQLAAEHAVACRMIAERNDLPLASAEACSMTDRIHGILDLASDRLETSWWAIPDSSSGRGWNIAPPPAAASHFLTANTATKLQIQHYTVFTLLYLPYLLQNHDVEKHAASRKISRTMSRAVVERFLAYRENNSMIMAGRPINYATLIAGMTLPLTYLERVEGDGAEVASDRDLLERSILIFRAMASYKHDRLSVESADTIHQLLPIMREGHGSREPLKLNVPFLGTVVIKHSVSEKDNLPQAPASPFSLNTSDTGLGFHQQLSLSLEQDQFGMHTPDTPGSLFGLGDSSQALLTASSPSTDPEKWIFQGIDTVYWSMLDQSINGQSDGQYDLTL